MKASPLTDFSRHLTAYLGKHLPDKRNLSANTIKAYRDVFVLFLRYARDERKLPPERLQLQDIDENFVSDFLEHLETSRGCGKVTRNHRLATLRAFFRWLQTEAPQHLERFQRILQLPLQKHSTDVLRYLSPGELETLLAQPSLTTRKGRRDAVILSLMFDAGLRCQELIDITLGDIRFEQPARLRVTGKGGKTRVVPLMDATVKLLRAYLREAIADGAQDDGRQLFESRQRQSFSRSGIRYIVSKYAKLARRSCVAFPQRIGPHTLRHTKAMSLRRAGIPLIVIRDILGHESVKTTEVYARVDLSMKTQALEKVALAAVSIKEPSRKVEPSILNWLESL